MQVFEPKSQQPVGQFVALHAVEVLTHTLLALHMPFETWQFEQNSPDLPHLSFAEPVSQRPVARSMQPLQGSHAPLTQVRPLGHAMHAAPPFPQRAVVAGFWQVPVEVQQPLGQFCALHDVAVPPALPPAIADPPPVVAEPPPVVAEPPPVAVPPPVELLEHRPPIWPPSAPAAAAITHAWPAGHAAHEAPFAPHCVSARPL